MIIFMSVIPESARKEPKNISVVSIFFFFALIYFFFFALIYFLIFLMIELPNIYHWINSNIKTVQKNSQKVIGWVLIRAYRQWIKKPKRDIDSYI
jgi:hypothetical protein